MSNDLVEFEKNNFDKLLNEFLKIYEEEFFEYKRTAINEFLDDFDIEWMEHVSNSYNERNQE